MDLRLTRALHRAAEDEREVLFDKHPPKLLGDPAPILRQRDIRGPRVLAAEAPRGLSMSDREHVHARPPEAQTLSALALDKDTPLHRPAQTVGRIASVTWLGGVSIGTTFGRHNR